MKYIHASSFRQKQAVKKQTDKNKWK